MDGVREPGKLRRVRSKRRRRLRTHQLRAALVVLAILAGISGASDLGYVTLKSRADQLQASLTNSLQAGQNELESGKTLLQQANYQHDASLVAQAITHFAAAKTDFQSAGQQADDSRFLHYLEYVPAVGQLAQSRHTAVDRIAEMGAALSDAGRDVAALDGEIIKPASAGEAGRTLLTVLTTVSAGLVTVKADLQTAHTAAAQVDVSVLPAGQQATFLKARDSIDSALGGFTEFERLVPVLTDVLGGNGARIYLIEQVNPAELRAGGGFIGTYSILRADHGALTLLRSGDAYDLADPRPLPGQPGFIPQPTPYREIIPDTSWSFVDSNIYPDFPSNALAAERFVQSRVGPLDGVISMDFYTVAKILDLTGPITVPGFNVTVDGGNFIPRIMQADVSRDFAYKQLLSTIAGPLMQRVSTLPSGRWPALIGVLNDLVSGRHLQAFFWNDMVEREMNRIAWSGTVNPTVASDFMMEVESNYYGDKVNYFLTRRYVLVLTRNGRLLHHQLSIDILNQAVCGSYDRTSYRANFRLYTAGNSSSQSDNLRSVMYPNPAPPAGTRFLDGWLPDVVCGGGRQHAVFEYDTPWPSTSKATAQIYWQKQPGTVADSVDVIWNDGEGDTFSVIGDLGKDRIVTLYPSAVKLTSGQPALANLPNLNLG